MADLSLDAYIAQRQTNYGNRNMRGGGIGSRLGAKNPRGRGRGGGRGGGVGGRGVGPMGRGVGPMGRGVGPMGRGVGPMGRGGSATNASLQFSVVGLGKVRGPFDARQKLSNPLKTTIQDARQKIRPKTVDARQMLETKKVQMAGIDVRNRIENNKAQKVDARQKINSARQAKEPQAGLGFQKITAPGSSPPPALSLILTQGPLTKTIHTNVVQKATKTVALTGNFAGNAARPLRVAPRVQHEQMGPLTRTVDNSYPGPIRQAPSMQVRQAPSMQVRQAPSMQVRQAPNMQVRQAPNMQVRQAPNMQVRQAPNMQVRQAPNMQVRQAPNMQVRHAPQQQSHTVLRPQSAPTSSLVITRRNLVSSRPSSTQHAQAHRGGSGDAQTGASRNTINMRGIRSASSEQWTGTESTLRSCASTATRGGGMVNTMVSVKNEMYHDDEDDDMAGGHHGGYRHSPPPSRGAPPQPVHQTAVWEAIQSITTKHVPEPRAAKVPVTDTVSPLQGYRVLVTNLHPVVSQDDIIELFGAVGALKKARLIKPGTAEVVFVTKEEALAAVRKYHLRELDSLPMQLVLTSRGGGPEAGTPQRTNTAQPGGAAPPPQQPAPGGPLKLSQLDVTNGKAASMSVDPNLIHKALFKTQSREDVPVRPVTFTVKI